MSGRLSLVRHASIDAFLDDAGPFLVARELVSGRQAVFLFTDLANPTANHIYATIGYQPVRDMNQYRFD